MPYAFQSSLQFQGGAYVYIIPIKGIQSQTYECCILWKNAFNVVFPQQKSVAQKSDVKAQMDVDSFIPRAYGRSEEKKGKAAAFADNQGEKRG